MTAMIKFYLKDDCETLFQLMEQMFNYPRSSFSPDNDIWDFYDFLEDIDHVQVDGKLCYSQTAFDDLLVPMALALFQAKLNQPSKYLELVEIGKLIGKIYSCYFRRLKFGLIPDQGTFKWSFGPCAFMLDLPKISRAFQKENDNFDFFSVLYEDLSSRLKSLEFEKEDDYLREILSSGSQLRELLLRLSLDGYPSVKGWAREDWTDCPALGFEVLKASALQEKSTEMMIKMKTLELTLLSWKGEGDFTIASADPEKIKERFPDLTDGVKWLTLSQYHELPPEEQEIWTWEPRFSKYFCARFAFDSDLRNFESFFVDFQELFEQYGVDDHRPTSQSNVRTTKGIFAGRKKAEQPTQICESKLQKCLHKFFIATKFIFRSWIRQIVRDLGALLELDDPVQMFYYFIKSRSLLAIKVPANREFDAMERINVKVGELYQLKIGVEASHDAFIKLWIKLSHLILE